MQHYKNFSISSTAIHMQDGTWMGKGVVLEPQAKLFTEIYRIETANDFIFLTKEEAEDFAVKLCKAWVEKAALYRSL